MTIYEQMIEYEAAVGYFNFPIISRVQSIITEVCLP